MEPNIQVPLDLAKISPIVAEYENLIKGLKEQIEYYKAEQCDIRREVQTVIEENNELNMQLKNALCVKASINFSTTPSDEVNNLKEQIQLINKEKEIAINLWHETQKEVDNLESQLNDPNKVDPEIVEHYDYKKIIEELRKDYENSLKSNKTSLNQVDKLQDEVTDLEEKLSCMTKCRDELQLALNSCQDHLFQVEGNDISNIEQINLLTKENENHIKNEKQLKDEIVNLKQTLDQIIEEAGRKVKEESEIITNEYTSKLNKMLTEFKQLEDNYHDKCDQISNLTVQNESLKQQLETFRNNNQVDEYEEKIRNLESKLDTTLNKLVLSERKNNQLVNEIESFKHDMDKMTREYERDIQIREMEVKKLENRIIFMRDELNCINKNFAKTVDDAKLYNDQLTVLQEELKRIKSKCEMYEQLCAQYTVIDEAKCLKSKYLESQIKLHSSLNHKWKQEVNDIILKFKTQLVKLVSDNKELKQTNEYLKKELISSRELVAQYVSDLKNIQ
ncbi:chromosome partition protein Smc [Chrysoperla carnea]|uniref:chromosome partition protein Smc n=1 Tax=Chrysoperla carnea TaxID=189513 RepID=UPI001D07F45D|nr:chromosome partition protein Smc [Chrysoperla carnea]